jgi:tetratricopeptide (TPR) repeat protein
MQMQLGESYIRIDQNEKAVSSFRKVVDQKGDDPGILNDVAYTLADNKISLDLSQQWAEKAVERLEEAVRNSESSDDAELRLTYQLSLTWDTLGWVYFRQGDLKRAEGLVRAAWQLSEASLVGEHLGEIYEKEGKKDQAARSYEYALAVSSIPRFVPGLPQTEAMRDDLRQANSIIARYEKLTGKKPSTDIRRLPSGEWTQTPAEQLRHSREVKLPNGAKLAGSAQFLVKFKPGKVDSAERVSGDADLEPLSGKLTAAHFPIEFPSDSGAVLLIRVDVKCETSTPCTATLVDPVPPATQFAGPTY